MSITAEGQRDDEGDARAGKAGVDVGVAGARHDAGARVQQLPGAEQRPQGADDEDGRQKGGDVGDGRSCGLTTKMAPRRPRRSKGFAGRGPFVGRRAAAACCTTSQPMARWAAIAKTSEATSAPTTSAHTRARTAA